MSKKINSNEGKSEEIEFENNNGFRNFNLYVILICGICVSLAGLYLTYSSKVSSSIPWPYKRGNSIAVINGPYVIVLGILTCIFPIFQLVKKRFKL